MLRCLAKKNDPTLSTTDKTKPLVDAYYFALHRLNKVSSTNTWGSQGPGVPPKEVTLKREWLSVTPNGENSDIFRWHLIPNNDDKRI